MEVEVRDISISDMENAAEAFISSTTKNITPVTSLFGYQDFAPQAGPITKQLQKLLHDLIYKQ